MFFGSKRQGNIEEYRDITDDVEESDFVPYAALFDAETLVTKNGELLQIIRIDGIRDGQEVRDAIRDSISACIPSDSFALWFHTLRRKKRATGEDVPDLSPFATQVNASWVEKNSPDRFVNELYVTIVREGQDAAITSPRVFLKGLFPKKDMQWRQDYLSTIHEELTSVVNAMLTELTLFKAKRLGVYEEEGVFYSEALRFLEKLTNLVDRPMPVMDIDLSEYLTEGEITFGFNAMEVRNADGRRRFASIITLKEHKEASLPAIDRFLNVPIEFIVTQTVNFINPKKALAKYAAQKRFGDISETDELTKLIELDHILASDNANPIDFGEQQLSVFLQADSLQELESYTRKALRYLGQYGMIAIREDLHFEECYWAQLPGNFEFVKRLIPTYTGHVGGFANLDTSPRGVEQATAWGDPLVLFQTATGQPYSFALHTPTSGKNGHMLMVGDGESDKSLVMHFLLTKALTKQQANLIYFDVDGKSDSFIANMGGVNATFYAGGAEALEHAVSLNPFSLPADQPNQMFVFRWMVVLLKMENQSIDESEMEVLKNAVAHVFSLADAERNIKSCSDYMMQQAPALAAKYAQWLPGGEKGFLFGHQDDVFANQHNILHFNLQHVIDNQSLFIPLMSYLLQRSQANLTGQPTIMVLQESLKLLQNTQVGMNVGGWLELMTSKNVSTWWSSSTIEAFDNSPLVEQLMPHIVTKMLFPEINVEARHADMLGLGETDMMYVPAMSAPDGHFMIKQETTDSVIACMNINRRTKSTKILQGKIQEDKAANIFQEAV